MKKLLIISILFLVSQVVYATDDTQVAAQQLADLLQKHQSYQGHFTQLLVDDKGETIQTSSGTFVVQKPGFFRWHTEEPFPQLLVSDMQNLWLYDPDLEQVTIRSYKDSIDDSPAVLFSADVNKIQVSYTVEGVSAQHFRLQPKQGAGNFIQLDIHFKRDLVSKMLLQDSLQQTTTFTFEKLEADPPKLVADMFTFIPPKGTDIIHDE